MRKAFASLIVVLAAVLCVCIFFARRSRKPIGKSVAALIVSYFGGQGFTNTMLKRAMINGSDPNAINRQGRAAGGKLDALGSFNYLLNNGR